MDDLKRAVASAPPEAAIVLGSGLGQVAAAAAERNGWAFGELPLPAAPTVVGHKGRLTHAVWEGRGVLIFEGRLHFYEGHPWEHVAAPVRLAADLGVKTLVLTNAAGGIRADLEPGALMLIRHHLKMNRPHWWRYGFNKSDPVWYSDDLNGLLLGLAGQLGIDLKTGIYGTVTGPSYETPAEIRAFRSLGSDAVGMSTAHEAETAGKLGLAVVGISCITNKAAGLSDAPLNHEEVLVESKNAAERLSRLLAAFVRSLPRFA